MGTSFGYNATATSALTAIQFTFLSTVPAIRSTHAHDDIVHCAEVTDLKKDCIKQPIVCTGQNLKPGYFHHRHLGENTLRATALDLRSEDNESKTFKLLVENPCCYPSHRRFIDIFYNLRSHRKVRSPRWPPFLAFKNGKSLNNKGQNQFF